MTACGPPDPTQFVAERLAGYLDCHAQSLAQDGYASLAGGWFGPALLGGCLTIYVALIGYRLILGAPFGIRDAVLASARAGVVIALATSWPAFETSIYRVVIDGPAEVTSQMLSSDLVIESLPDAAKRLDDDYNSLHSATGGGAVAETSAALAPSPPGAPQAMHPQPQPSTDRADPVLDRAGFSLVVVTVGSLGALRLAAGLLLGSGPLFITLGLFNVTVGLLEGWVRALFGVFVGAAASMIVTSLELGFIESQLAQVGQNIGDSSALGEAALAATAFLFALVMAVALIVAGVVGYSFRIAPLLRHVVQGGLVASGSDARPAVRREAIEPIFEPALRAQTVADAARRIRLRETAALTPPMRDAMSASRLLGRSVRQSAPKEYAHLETPGAATSLRRLSRSRTASADQRDRR